MVLIGLSAMLKHFLAILTSMETPNEKKDHIVMVLYPDQGFKHSVRVYGLVVFFYLCVLGI